MKIWILVSVFLCQFAMLPARTMKQLFVQMPQELMPELSNDNKLDCIDFLASGMKATVQNRFGENSSLLKINDTYALLSISSALQCEMRLLPNGKDTLLCMVKTYFTPEAESTVCFYNMKWEVQPESAHLVEPAFKDFELVLPQGTACVNPGLVLKQARLSETDNTITFTLNCSDFNPDLKKETRVKKELSYQWKEGRFELVPAR